MYVQVFPIIYCGRYPVYISTVFIYNTIIIMNVTGTNFLRTQQKIEYASLNLPHGAEIDNFKLKCILRVFDSFNAFEDLNTLVKVEEEAPQTTNRRALSIGNCLYYIGYGAIYVYILFYCHNLLSFLM
jgi:hypothetical protein